MATVKQGRTLSDTTGVSGDTVHLPHPVSHREPSTVPVTGGGIRKGCLGVKRSQHPPDLLRTLEEDGIPHVQLISITIKIRKTITNSFTAIHWIKVGYLQPHLDVSGNEDPFYKETFFSLIVLLYGGGLTTEKHTIVDKLPYTDYYQFTFLRFETPSRDFPVEG